MDTAELLRKLCAINAMTGFENKACEAIQGLFQPVCDKAWVDPFFNVIG